MLPKKSRLTRGLFSTLLASKRFYHTPHFVLRVAASSEVRVGVSVSKKVARKAAIRNRTRRRAYAAVAAIPSLPQGIYLLSAKSGAETLKGETLAYEVAELLKKSYNH